MSYCWLAICEPNECSALLHFQYDVQIIMGQWSNSTSLWLLSSSLTCCIYGQYPTGYTWNYGKQRESWTPIQEFTGNYGKRRETWTPMQETTGNYAKPEHLYRKLRKTTENYGKLRETLSAHTGNYGKLRETLNTHTGDYGKLGEITIVSRSLP